MTNAERQLLTSERSPASVNRRHDPLAGGARSPDGNLQAEPKALRTLAAATSMHQKVIEDLGPEIRSALPANGAIRAIEGQQYSDGLRYKTYYVPIACREPVAEHRSR